METIAEYTEQRIGHYKNFRLSHDRIYISQPKGLGPRFEMSFMLENIDPERDRFWVSDPEYSMKLMFLFIACLVPFGILMNYGKNNFTLTVLGFVVLLAPVAIGALLSKRIEYSSFVSTTGNGVFEVGRIGKNKDKYEQFVESIVLQVKKCQGSPNQAL